MPKSRGRKKKKKSPPAKARGLTFNRLPQLSPEEHAAFKDAALAYARDQPATFDQQVEVIERILKNVDVLQMLSLAASYGLQGLMGEDGVQTPNPFSREGFSQHHLELCQAMALRLPPDQYHGNPLVGSELETLVKALRSIADAFAFQRLVQIDQADFDEKHLLVQIQERLRLHTQVVRNWGNFGQVVDHSKRLYCGLDDKFQSAFGMTASQLVELFHGLVLKVEKQSSERLEMLSRVFNPALKLDQMVAKYFELNPELIGTPETFLAALPDGFTRSNLMALIFNHSDLRVGEFYTLTSIEAARIVGAPVKSIEHLFELLSHRPGELANCRIDHMLLDNPVWAKPIIRLSDGSYFVAMPQAFFSHVHRVFAHLCAQIKIDNALEKCRSSFLESELDRIIRIAFPDAKVISNVKWSLGTDQFETDTVAIIDRTLIIAEAKSGTISDPALRGAPQRAKRHVDELVVHPSQQSARLARTMEAAQQGDLDAQKALKNVGLWPLDINRFVRLTVTLDDFSVIASAEKELKRVGWVDAQHDLAPAMTAADLEMVCEILDEASLIHYFSERARLQKRFEILADEIDWLGFYLETGFAFAASEKSELDGLILTGLSDPIDVYTTARDHGVEKTKPTPRRSKLWTEILHELARRQMPGWIEASIALLRAASPDEQKKVERAFRKLITNVSREWKKPHRKNGLTISPAFDDAIAIVLFAHPGVSLEEQRAEALGFSGQCFENSLTKTCLVIGFNSEKPKAPFDYLTFVARNEV